MKEPKKLFSVGEISKALGITRRIILNYEDKGLIVPDRKNGDGGSRYYSIDTFTRIRTVRVFQNLGLSLDEIRKYLDDYTDLEPLIKRLETMRDELNLSIERLKERTNTASGAVSEITVAPQTVFCKKYVSPSISEKTVLLRETALEAMTAYGTDITRRMYFTEYSADDPDTVSYCVAVPSHSEGENIFHLPQFNAVTTYHHGSYETVSSAKERLIAYAEERGLKLTGQCRHTYVEGPPHHKDLDKFITQVIMPIKE